MNVLPLPEETAFRLGSTEVAALAVLVTNKTNDIRRLAAPAVEPNGNEVGRTGPFIREDGPFDDCKEAILWPTFLMPMTPSTPEEV
jgi:hypothetical protein